MLKHQPLAKILLKQSLIGFQVALQRTQRKVLCGSASALITELLLEAAIMTRVGILEEVPLGKLQRCLTVSTTTCRPSPGGNSGFAHLQLRFILVRKSSPHHHLTEMVEEFDLRARTRGQPPAFGSKPEEHVQARCDHTHIILSLPPSNMPFTPLTTNGRILQRCHSTSPGQASTYKTLMQSCIYTSQHHL